MKKSFNFLLIEDNAGDALLIKKAMKDPRFDIRVHVLADGTKVMTYLRGRNERDPVQNTDVILLDLSLPAISGFEVLKRIKSDPLTKSIPVVVVTGSGMPGDARIAYELGAAGYFEKPVGFEELRKRLQAFVEFYFDVAKLPTKL